MKATKKFILLLSLLVFAATPSVFADSGDWVTSNPLIAHAFGGIDDKTYTNSLEAFQTNYDKGFRVFEVDLILTSDGGLAARHDWQPYRYDVFEQDVDPAKRDEPLTLQEFKSLSIHRTYQPLDFTDIAYLLQQHKDMYIVTDTKETNEADIKKAFSVIVNTAKQIDPEILDRIIPQIYNEEMYPIVENIHPFKSYIYTLYQTYVSNDRILNFALKNGIDVITMDHRRFTPEFTKRLKDNGIYTYVNTINDPEEASTYLKNYVHGLYTDFLEPEDINRTATLGVTSEVIDQKITLFENTRLYDEPSYLNATHFSISPQKVHAIEKTGSWYKIQTWLGEKWIIPRYVMTGEPEPVSEVLTLQQKTNLYGFPFPEGKTIYALSPQKVQATHKWNGWYKIKTWLGEMWVK